MNHEDWGVGPWNNEEDHAVWVDEATDLDCMINRGPSGALCGYVGVPPSHPLHGEDYAHMTVDLDVHGGLTFSSACQEGGEICHIPEPGREHDIWWFGFDCAHFMDYAPRIEMDMRVLAEWLDKPELLPTPGVYDPFPKFYKDWDYVKGEIRDLARQLKALQ